MPNFIPSNHKQTVLLAIHFEDQLQPGTFEHALHYLISDRIDLSEFHACYKNDDNGRPAIDPANLLKIILFAYSKGITSSREIAWCCQNNILFKALSCDTIPHFTTIAHFISGYKSPMEDLFEKILLVCDEEGLLGNELFAIDGCKMSSNAGKEWSGTFKELKEKRDKLKKKIQHCIERHQQLDMLEEHKDYQDRLKQRETTLQNAYEKIDEFLKTNEPRIGQGKRPKEVKSNITDNESAKMKTGKGTLQGYNGIATVDKKHQIIVDAQAFGEGQEHHTLQPVLETVNERFNRLKIKKDILKSGTIITADTGFSNEANNQYLHESGINAYIPDQHFRDRDVEFNAQKQTYGKRHQDEKSNHPIHSKQVIPSYEFNHNALEKTCVCPAGETLSYRGERTDICGNIKQLFEGRLLQCRHCELKHQCMKNPSSADHRHGSGRQVSFIVNKEIGEIKHTEWMKERVDSEKGKIIYGHRMSVVEPVFANIGSNKKLSRFSLRGKAKVDTQWKLFCMVHNLEKIANYGKWVA